MSEFLLEIGTEELPASFANSARIQIKELSEKWLKENNISFGNLKTFSTPRRLVLIIEDILSTQPDIQKELKGPAVNVAYDTEGNPTKALQGFCKSQNIDINTLEKKEFKGNMFVYATVNQSGKNTVDLLPALFSHLLSSVSVTRAMRWADYTTKFSRPIQWILSLFDGQIIDMSTDDISSSNFTFGHRFLSKGKIEINSVQDYMNKLLENKVIVDNEKRKELIKTQLQEAANNLSAQVVIEEELLDEVNQLVEYPSAITGSFEDKYLEVPEIVNVTVMKAHQRYFPLYKNDKLLPNFITVSNMNMNPDNIRKGNQRVLKARLDDAMFYYGEDLKHKLADHTEELKRVTYFEEVGSIYDKTQRIEKIALEIATKYFKDINSDDIKRAVQLLKTDLVTNMVKEFTELQGEIGYYYSLKEAENNDVAFAIKEQYLPTGNNENLPSKSLSQLINFSDKLDNLICCFSLGKIPTGSKDPFSLRRQSLGIIKTCDKYGIPFNLNEALGIAFDTLINQKSINADKNEVTKKINEFFVQRLKNDILDRGIRYDVVDAILDSENNLDNLSSLQAKAQSLNDWLKGDIENTVTALARVIRISKEKPTGEINQSLFEKEEEKDLYLSVAKISESLKDLGKEDNYAQYLNRLSELVNPINKFFDNVMVMVENQEVKTNRLNLLYSIKDLSDKIGNMDKVVLSA